MHFTDIETRIFTPWYRLRLIPEPPESFIRRGGEVESLAPKLNRTRKPLPVKPTGRLMPPKQNGGRRAGGPKGGAA